MSFADLNLNPKILAALNKCGYTVPTPVQLQAIPSIMAGKDVIATAQTGTGKTAAFVLPMLHKLLDLPKQKLPQVLILAPVRELAAQIDTAIKKYSSQTGLKVVNVFGGMPYHAQRRQLEQPFDILVATPGRLIDYLERGGIDLSQVSMFVLDEADRMLDMGFIEDVKVIAKYLSAKHQTLMFTATLDDRINKLAHKLLHSPEHIAVKTETVTLEQIEQKIYYADHVDHKHRLLQHLLEAENIFKAIIFVATKHYADKLATQLNRLGFKVDTIHGDIKQQKRNRILQDFRTGKINILIATDVAARGIDVADVSHVINFDITRSEEDYVHRIGRTGRAGKTGIAISFVLRNETGKLKQIERFIAGKITEAIVEGMEPQPASYRDETRDKKSGSGRGRGGNQRRGGAGEGRRGDSERGRSSSPRGGRSSHAGKPARSAGGYRGRDEGQRGRREAGSSERPSSGRGEKRDYASKPRRYEEAGNREPRFERKDRDYSARPRRNEEAGNKESHFARKDYSARPRRNNDEAGNKESHFARKDYSARPRRNDEVGNREPRFERKDRDYSARSPRREGSGASRFSKPRIDGDSPRRSYVEGDAPKSRDGDNRNYRGGSQDARRHEGARRHSRDDAPSRFKGERPANSERGAGSRDGERAFKKGPKPDFSQNPRKKPMGLKKRLPKKDSEES